MDALLPLVLRDAKNVGHKVQVLDAGQKFVQVGVIGNIGQILLAGNGIVLNAFSRDPDAAAVGLQNAAAGLDGRRLARAVVAAEAVNFARSNVQRQIVDGNFAAEGFPLCFEAGGLSLCRSREN